jgi:hypothetical protein
MNREEMISVSPAIDGILDVDVVHLERQLPLRRIETNSESKSIKNSYFLGVKSPTTHEKETHLIKEAERPTVVDDGLQRVGSHHSRLAWLLGERTA